MSPWRWPVAAAALAAGVALQPATRPLAAQDNPAIRTAVRLAAEGRSDSARHLVEAALSRARPGDSAYAEALFWRARLATFGDSAELGLRQVTVDYPTSSWADDALLELAALAMTAGNPASARALAERIRTDYPGSDLRASAALWAGRAALEMADVAGGCAELDSARMEAGRDTDLQNRVAFYRARCPSRPPSPPDTAAVAPPAPAPAPPPDSVGEAPATSYLVQVGASRSDGEIQRFVDIMRRTSWPTHVVRGPGGFRRVRVGPFATLREAEAVAREARRMVGGEPYVVRGP